MLPPGRRILCVEDHQATRELLQMLFNLHGYEARFAATIAEALLLARSERFDLYLLDNFLPDGSGIDLCQWIREFDRETPVVFYSLWNAEDDRQRALAAGAQAYLGKLRGSDDLVKTMARLIADHASQEIAVVSSEGDEA